MPKEGIEKMAQRVRKVNVRDTPLGVKPIRYIEEEIPLDGGAAMPADKSENVSFTSVDGNSYSFALKNKDGKVLPNRIALSVYLSLIETEKGGNASTVLDAFRVTIEDLAGKQVYPILHTSEPVVEEEEASDFSLGADLGEAGDTL
jgi:hypothetical protein